MRILLTGHKGQLGQTLQKRLDANEITGLDIPEGDATDRPTVEAMFRDHQFDLVIHAAALTNVDYCAEHPDEAFRINAGSTLNLIQQCRASDIPFVYVSTNEVFNGQSKTPYLEYAPTDPINPYAYSKYAGEQLVRQYLTHYYIVRTAWLYSVGGVNFVHRVIARANAGELIKVVTDEIGSPTYVEDLAEAMTRLIETRTYGTFHLVNEGSCSRYDFARELLDQVGKKDVPIEPTTSAAFTRASTPPPYSALKNQFAAMLGITLRPWQEAVADFAKTLTA